MDKKRNNKLNIAYMCQLAGVSRSGYYNYIKHRNLITKRELDDQLSFSMINLAASTKYSSISDPPSIPFPPDIEL